MQCIEEICGRRWNGLSELPIRFTMELFKCLCYALKARRARRCCKKSRNLAGDVIKYDIPVPDSGSSYIRISFRQRALACLAPYHYADTAKAFPSAAWLTNNNISVLAKLWRKMEKGLVFLYRIGYHMYYSIISQYF